MDTWNEDWIDYNIKNSVSKLCQIPGRQWQKVGIKVTLGFHSFDPHLWQIQRKYTNKSNYETDYKIIYMIFLWVASRTQRKSLRILVWCRRGSNQWCHTMIAFVFCLPPYRLCKRVLDKNSNDALDGVGDNLGIGELREGREVYMALTVRIFVWWFCELIHMLAENESYHDAKFEVTRLWHQWRQSWHDDNSLCIVISVFE